MTIFLNPIVLTTMAFVAFSAVFGAVVVTLANRDARRREP